MAYLKSKVPPRKNDEKGPEHYYGEALKFNRHDFEAKIEFTNILVETSKHKALRQLEDAAKIHHGSSGRSKPELLNNIAVLQIDNGQYEEAEKNFVECLGLIDSSNPDNEEDELKKKSLSILCRFNYGICLEKLGHWHGACEVYQGIVNENKYHLDSYCRLAYSLSKLGDVEKMAAAFELAERSCS